MCGRFVLAAPPEELRRVFGYPEQPNFPPRYNIAPTQPIAMVARFEGQRRFLLVRWGLIPSWVKDPAAFTLLINARSETAAEKPAFRAAMKYRRCLIPASGFYEWRRPASGPKEPFYIRPADGSIAAFAGLYETYSSKDGSEIDTAAILTTDANSSFSWIHDRLPAVIPPAGFDAWLDPAVTADEARRFLTPVPDDYFEAIRVSDRVNVVRNDDATNLEPASAPPEPVVKPARKVTKGGGGEGGGQMSLF